MFQVIRAAKLRKYDKTEGQKSLKKGEFFDKNSYFGYILYENRSFWSIFCTFFLLVSHFCYTFAADSNARFGM